MQTRLDELVGRRRRPGSRWSSSFSVALTAADGTRRSVERPAALSDAGFAEACWGATTVRFRWRHDGQNRSAAFELPSRAGDAAEFRNRLIAAIVGDGPADTAGRPVAPGATADPTPAPAPTPPEAQVVAMTVPRSRRRPVTATTSGEVIDLRRTSAPEPAGPGLRVAGREAWADLEEKVVPLGDVDALAAWRLDDLGSTKSRRGTRRSPTTLVNVEAELRIATDFLRYLPGDPRVVDGHALEGASMRFDGPAAITEADCIAFVRHRANLNLRTRAANLHAEARWANAVDQAWRDANRSGRRPELVAPPDLAVERADRRTVESTCTTLAAALRDAQAEGAIATNPWTPRVERHVDEAPATVFHERDLLSPAQVIAVASHLASMTRHAGWADGAPVIHDGDRFAALVLICHDAALRPQEAVAVRDSWVITDGSNPGILLRHAEVRYPLDHARDGRSLTPVPLKLRAEGDTRWVPLSAGAAAAYARHRERYVPAPDPNSPDPDRRDPRAFTMHSGAPLNPSAFTARWWRPALDELFAAPGHAALRALQFRHLRHAGITALLAEGHSYDTVATWAGNSPLVIRRHYRGVIDRLGTQQATRRRSGLRVDVAALARQIAGCDDQDEVVATIGRELPDLDATAKVLLGRALHRTGRHELNAEELT